MHKAVTHEIMHALGLDHAFGTSDSANNFVFNDNLDGRETSDVFTLMTYEDKSLNGHAVWDADPMLYDVAMLQYLYGARDSDPTNSYLFPTALPDLKTIWDTGPGRDTLNGRDDINANLSLVPGTHSSIVPTGYADASTGDLYNNVAIAFNTIIEDCNGGAMADTIVGNHVGNIINGKGGNDKIFGCKVEYHFYNNNQLEIQHGLDDGYRLTATAADLRGRHIHVKSGHMIDLSHFYDVDLVSNVVDLLQKHQIPNGLTL